MHFPMTIHFHFSNSSIFHNPHMWGLSFKWTMSLRGKVCIRQLCPSVSTDGVSLNILLKYLNIINNDIKLLFQRKIYVSERKLRCNNNLKIFRIFGRNKFQHVYLTPFVHCLIFYRSVCVRRSIFC